MFNDSRSARYEALRLWDKTLKSADSEFWVQLSPGTAVGEYLNPDY